MGTKQDKFDTVNFEIVMKNAIWTTEAFHFTPKLALKYINSGMLGYKEKNGQQLKDAQNKPIPITISRATYFRYKEKFTDLPKIYEDIREFGMKGYAHLIKGFTEELATLHRMAIEIMLSEKDGLNRLNVISELVKNIIPAESAFADMLKKISRHYQEPTAKEEPNAKSENIPA